MQTDATRLSAPRPWHASWPPHVPLSFDYPSRPAYWILERSLGRFSDRPAIRYLDHRTGAELDSLTYGQLHRMARSLALGLMRLGVRKGDRVALYLPNRPELVVSYYGIWMAGGVAVPCSSMSRESELSFQLSDSGARVLISEAELVEVAAEVAHSFQAQLILAGTGAQSADRFPLSAIRLQDLLLDSSTSTLMEALDPRHDLAVLLYTGGTTGAPKGAMLTHYNVVANTIQFATWYAFEDGAETCVSVLPLFHSGGFSGAMNVPLYSGATLLLMERFNPLTVVQTIEQHRATRFFGVPTMFIGILNNPACREYDLSSLQACRTNAAPLPVHVKESFDELVGHETLIEGYGLTEASPLTHANPLQRAVPGSIGIPLPDTDARIIDLDTGSDVPPGMEGELVIRGPQVMMGYWNKGRETEAATAGGWLHTGDIARMDENGYFYVVDRMKDVINTAGFKVWPREVEEVLYSHPAVSMAVVLGVPDPYRGEAVKAFVALRDEVDGGLREAELIAFCKERLSSYKVPRSVEFRTDLPVNAAGKLARRLLRQELDH